LSREGLQAGRGENTGPHRHKKEREGEGNRCEETSRRQKAPRGGREGNSPQTGKNKYGPQHLDKMVKPTERSGIQSRGKKSPCREQQKKKTTSNPHKKKKGGQESISGQTKTFARKGERKGKKLPVPKKKKENQRKLKKLEGKKTRIDGKRKKKKTNARKSDKNLLAETTTY